jgi:hypothetical protein
MRQDVRYVCWSEQAEELSSIIVGNDSTRTNCKLAIIALCWNATQPTVCPRGRCFVREGRSNGHPTAMVGKLCHSEL